MEPAAIQDDRMARGHGISRDLSGGHCPMTKEGEELLHLLHSPLTELSPPGFGPSQLEGLRGLPELSKKLRLIHAVKALEPLVDQGPSAAGDALILASEILSALGRFLAKNRDVSLSALRFAAALTVIDLHSLPGPTPEDEAEIFLTPEVLFLEGAAMMPLWRARSAGKSEKILRCAARMILHLWDYADQLRRSPEGGHGHGDAPELLGASGRASGTGARPGTGIGHPHQGDDARRIPWK